MSFLKLRFTDFHLCYVIMMPSATTFVCTSTTFFLLVALLVELSSSSFAFRFFFSSLFFLFFSSKAAISSEQSRFSSGSHVFSDLQFKKHKNITVFHKITGKIKLEAHAANMCYQPMHDIFYQHRNY